MKGAENINLFGLLLSLLVNDSISSEFLLQTQNFGQKFNRKALSFNSLDWSGLFNSSGSSFPFNRHMFFDSPQLNLEVTLQGIVENATQISIQQVEMDDTVNLALDLTFHDLNFHGSYMMNGMALKMIPLSGQGHVELGLQELRVATKFHIYPVSGVLFLQNFNFFFSVDYMKVSIGGLLNDTDISNLLDKFIGDLVPELAYHLNLKLAQMIEEFISNQPAFNKMQLEDLIEITKLLI